MSVGQSATCRRGVLLEVNSETDFVARNQVFQEFVQGVTLSAVASGGDGNDRDGAETTMDIEALLNAPSRYFDCHAQAMKAHVWY